jgi:uncharacterized membrane protein HdeD (DUF308 family)
MNPREMRLSRPVYESLPWLYVLSGLAALAASYFRLAHPWSLISGVLGLLLLLGGIVVLLRRRDFRQMRANHYLDPESPGYLNPDSAELPPPED